PAGRSVALRRAGRGRHRRDRLRSGPHPGNAGEPLVKRIALAAVISLATLTVAALLWRFRVPAILFALSVVASAAARPAVDALERRPGRAPAAPLSSLMGLTLFAIFVSLASRGVLGELDAAADRLSAAYERLRLQAGA